MKKLILPLLMIVVLSNAKAQSLSINTDGSIADTSALLDIKSTTKGMLPPRMSTAQRTAIFNPANGLMVFDNTTNSYWYFENGMWVELSSAVGLKSVNGSATFTPYNINPKRYMWELTTAIPPGTSIPIPQSILDDLCGDEDGCRITVSMQDYNFVGQTTEIISNSAMFYYAPLISGKRTWRVCVPILDGSGGGNNKVGTDGDGTPESILNIYSSAYLTDGNYSGSVGDDSAVGLSFLKWTFYPSSTIRLIIED